jgi:hypothetical protein
MPNEEIILLDGVEVAIIPGHGVEPLPPPQDPDDLKYWEAISLLAA